MKEKRKRQSRKDKFLGYILWTILGCLLLLGIFSVINSRLAHYFVIPSELIPTAQYLQEHPDDNDFQLVLWHEDENDEFLYGVCIDTGNVELNYDNRTGSIFIDGRRTLTLPERTKSLSILYCARGVYLEKGLHLIEYKSENVAFNQKWSMGIE